jgi:pentatricopeptide repeat protein
MRLAVYYLIGDFSQACDLEAIDYMVDEMQERGFMPDGITARFFSDPNLMVRDNLQAAINWGEAIMLPQMEGRGRIMPFIDFLAKSGKPLFIPQIPTFPQGQPLDRPGIREIFAWNDAMKSKARADAMAGKAKGGGDQGYRPTPESAARARAAKTEAAEETAVERETPVWEAYEQHGSYTAAAKALEESGVPTPSGKGKWHPEIVKRVLKRTGRIK